VTIGEGLSDVNTVGALAARHDLPPERIWIVPEGRVGAHVREGTRQLADATLEAGFNLSSRLAVTLWGDALRPL
jgi:7-carboxy-7-deazaguanine synthase